MHISYLMAAILTLFSTTSFGANQKINLVIHYKTVNFAGKPTQAIAVNNQIPAPTLHFKEGDKVTINVRNELDQETAVHWHGIIIPWQMDGVEGISQEGIPPGKTFQYQFTLRQSGTYWYHAHAGLQEQQGLYGAFIIDPPKHPPYHYTKDYTVVLSDWSNTLPNQILANLKKQGDYYSPNFPLQPSLKKFIHDYQRASKKERANLLDDYQMMQEMRMSIYDFSDVAYDAFLLNGKSKKSPWVAPVKKGDVVRLRFIGAGGSTIFHIKIPNTVMQVIHVQGNDIKPFAAKELTLAPGETIDVLVKIKSNNPYIIYAESIDTRGAALGALASSAHQVVNYESVKPFPEPLPITREMMTNMMGDMMHHHMSHTMDMPTESTIKGDAISPPTSIYTTSTNTQYQPLKAFVKTNDPNKPVAGVIKMELFGYMDKYIWFINGIPENKARPIILKPGKRYRFVFTNTSMMHHPMHIHGHWFILRKGHGSYDPLLHTIDVPPGATITADVDTDASGQWIFHCHLLYHMMTGMARTLQYSTLIEITQNKAKPETIIKKTAYSNRPIVRVDEEKPIDVSLVKNPMAHKHGWWFANLLDIGANPVTNVQQVTFKGLYGSDYNKLELYMNDAEIIKGTIENADLDIFYWRLLSQFWAAKGGVNYFYRPTQKPYWQPGIGIEGLLPYFIETDLRGYLYSGSAKLDIELTRDTQITNNFFIQLAIRSILASKTVSRADIGSGLNQMQYILKPYYRLMPGLNVFAALEHDQYYGTYKTMQIDSRNTSAENTLTFGLSILF